MALLETHCVDAANEAIAVEAHDAQTYTLAYPAQGYTEGLTLRFAGEASSGITIEALLAVVLDRLSARAETDAASDLERALHSEAGPLSKVLATQAASRAAVRAAEEQAKAEDEAAEAERVRAEEEARQAAELAEATKVADEQRAAFAEAVRVEVERALAAR
jgi:hypothetical protein